jgi:SNF2 family DNA or RNA helicase
MLSRDDFYAYQNRGVQHIKDNPFCALWEDMGLGKTVQTLTAIKELKDSFDVDKTLITGPLRVVRKTWDDEIASWEHLEGLTTAHILGTEKQRLAALEQKADIHLINRENLDWLKRQYVKGTGKKMKMIKRWPWDNVILDESSSFKSSSSLRTKAVAALRQHYGRMTQLTGTPSPNGYEDLWAQFKLLDRGQRLGFTKKAFLSRWFTPPDRWDPASSKYAIKEFAATQIQDAVRDLVLSLKAEDYLDLPDVMYNPIPVELSDAERGIYDKMKNTFVTELAGKKITAVNAGVLTGKLLQLSNGNIYTGVGKEYEHFHSRKYEALEELLESSSGPVMVTAWFKPDMRAIEQIVARFCGRQKKWEVLSDTASEDRWNNGETDVLILHPASAGHGLNLHKSDCETIIWFGLTWSLELYQQLNARIAGGHRRIGKNVIIHHILSRGTMDDRVFKVLQYKGATQDALIEATKEIIREAA